MLGSLDEMIKPFGPIHEAHLDFKVADLLITDMEWNKRRIEVILPEMVSKIQCLYPSKEGAEEAFIWQLLQSGNLFHKVRVLLCCGRR